jgi:hypothetical protein
MLSRSIVGISRAGYARDVFVEPGGKVVSGGIGCVAFEDDADGDAAASGRRWHDQGLEAGDGNGDRRRTGSSGEFPGRESRDGRITDTAGRFIGRNLLERLVKPRR